MATPTSGQDYVKLALAEASNFLVDGKPSLALDVTGECGAFFENWLAAQYRRGNEDAGMEHLVFFPALLTSRQELAGLVRFPVHIEWCSANGSVFLPPSAVERAKKRFPEPPATLKVLASFDEGSPPLFVDTRVLSELLRIDADRLEPWLGELSSERRSARDVLLRTCALLAAQVAADSSDAGPAPGVEPPSNTAAPPAELVAVLATLVKRRLTQISSVAKAYDVGVLLDASRNRATFHVQRDIQAALDLLDPELEASLPAHAPLLAYLGRRRASGTRSPLLGRFRGQSLTDSQRAAGELFLGSHLSAVQGPPGTGKTHLILGLAAEQLLTNTLALCEAKQPGQDLLVVTSTNNRAVDNVIEPMSRQVSGLPLALRVGSREVMERLTAVELEKVARWLERQPEPSDDAWLAATTHLKELHTQALRTIASETEARSHAAKLAQIAEELEALEHEASAVSSVATEPASKVTPLSSAADFELEFSRVRESVKELKAHTTSLLLRLRALSSLSEDGRRTALLALEQHWKLTTTRHVTPMSELLGAHLPLGLPPEYEPGSTLDGRRSSWEDATEAAIAIATEFDDWLSRLYARETSHQRTAELRARRELLEQNVPQGPHAQVDWSALEPDLHALFDASCRVRELWAAKNKKTLLEALQRAVATCKGQKSLRTLMTASKGPGVWLRRLFPVWGCTLLSLGNNFAPEPESLAKVVIDEAGQCHPAYAVSALLRAQSALVIGDTNQLEPVVELSAADEARLLKPIKEKHRGWLTPFRAYEGSYTSAQSVADRAVASRPVLVDHFRCQAEIALICEQLCNYGLVARAPAQSCAHVVAELDHPLLSSAVNGEQRRLLGSWCNEAEVTQVAAWVSYLLRAGLAPADVGVITPFRGQLDLLWRQLRQARIPLERPLGGDDDEQLSLLSRHTSGVALGTVHRFQGGERRVILFTTTVTDAASLRFLNERVNLVNVAVSRAKEHLITIGHAPTLKAGANTRLLVERARQRVPPLLS